MPAARYAKVGFLQQSVVPDLILISLLLLFCIRISTSRGSSRDRAMSEAAEPEGGGHGSGHGSATLSCTVIRNQPIFELSPVHPAQTFMSQDVKGSKPGYHSVDGSGEARRGETRRKIQARRASCMCS
ncbi:hypothetical protein BDP55DRAFT_263617 [Colletotrichum godetiae]|uniref:Uncharacterized protein n=1 Tax=Colletotrichum godetiae TaxID=1209918 RepID=A0AAJ0AVZ9_9PEZI|nr:uncharacterized protein BDP55DRAFT_263617 [Colletotrichum godetiae]KAK1691398.1 hypothetical protein BDP55DRAFT_263617 [Colletotrichum godetiae]